MAKGYHTKRWAEHTVFECDDCPVDSEFEETIQAHVAALHPETKPKPKAEPEPEIAED